MNVAQASTVWLPVGDLDSAVRFYCETLGLQERQRENAWAEVEADGLRIGLNAHEQERPGGAGGAVIAFQPEEKLERAVEQLRAQGVEFPSEISEHPWGRVATFKDPSGNDLQLYEPPA